MKPGLSARVHLFGILLCLDSQNDPEILGLAQLTFRYSSEQRIALNLEGLPLTTPALRFRRFCEVVRTMCVELLDLFFPPINKL